MASAVQGKDSDYDDSTEEDLVMSMSVPLLSPEKIDERHRDHCDYLLDAIDEQLDQLQSRSSFKASLKNTDDTKVTSAADMEQRHEISCQESKEAYVSKSGEPRTDTETKKDEYKWRLAQLLGCEEADNQEYHSDGNSAESVCTEDFAVKFKQGMVEPIACSRVKADAQCTDGRPLEDYSENLSLSLPLCEGTGDHFTLNTARREDILQQFKEELEDDLQAALTFSVEDTHMHEHRQRRDSIESLGGQISRLSQVHTSEHSSTHSLEKSGSVVGHSSSKNDFQAPREDKVTDNRSDKYAEIHGHVPNVSLYDTPTSSPNDSMHNETCNLERVNTEISKDIFCTQDLPSQMDMLDGARTIGSEDDDKKKHFEEIITKNKGNLQTVGHNAPPSHRLSKDKAIGNSLSSDKDPNATM